MAAAVAGSLLLAAPTQFALRLGTGALAGAVLDAAGAVLPVLGAPALAYEAAAAGLIRALADGGVLGEMVVELEERHGEDGGVAVVQAADADAEPLQRGVQLTLQLHDPEFQGELA
ncbi:hypothetical protein H4K36_01140 [Streptomyces sp. DHE7-1]|nr:hypothetical protein [Streptomyces sp. DHE7-1]